LAPSWSFNLVMNLVGESQGLGLGTGEKGCMLSWGCAALLPQASAEYLYQELC